MARKKIVVAASGGIAAGAPFTIGRTLIVQAAVPATAGTSRVGQLPDAWLSFDAPDVTGAAQTFVLGPGSHGGLSQKTVLVGHNIVTNQLAGSDRNIGLGGNINFAAAAGGNDNNIWIGWDFVIGTPTNTSNNVLIGHSTTTTVAGSGSVVLGNDNSMRGGDSVTIGNLTLGGNEGNVIGKQAQGGDQAQAFGKLAFATGAKSIAIGDRAKATQDNEIAIGPNLNAHAFQNAVRIGRSSEVFEDNSWGLGGDQNNGTEMRVLRLGPNTLAGYPGLSIFLPSTAAGNNQPAPNTTVRAGISTGNATTGGRYIFQTGTVGASGGTYQTVASRFELGPGGVAGTPSIRFTGQISTPGAAAGTLANAPTAGDPAVWAEVMYNGVLSYIPMWQ